MLKLMRQYMAHVQNSVFEGELTKAQVAELRHKAKVLMNPEEDSLILYAIRNAKWVDKVVLGVEKRQTDQFL